MKWFLSFLVLAFSFSIVYAQTVPAPQGVAAMVCANNTVVPAPTNGKFFYVQCDANGKLITNGLAGSPGQIPGTTTNDNAASGNVGEYILSTVFASNMPLTTGTATNSGATITLTPGDWVVSANAEFAPAATTNVTQWICSISGTSGALNTNGGYIDRINTGAFVPNANQNCIVGPIRVAVATTTQLWLVVQSNFTASTQTAGGNLSARRAR